MEVQGPRFWRGFGHDLGTFLKTCKKNVPPPVDPIQRVSGVRWRMDTNIDLFFISVWNRLSAKVLVNLKLFENLVKSMNLKKTYEHWFSFYFSLKSFECKSTSRLEIWWNQWIWGKHMKFCVPIRFELNLFDGLQILKKRTVVALLWSWVVENRY